MQPVALILGSILLGVVGQLALKAGVSGLGPLMLSNGQAIRTALSIAGNVRIWTGLGLYGVSTLLWLVALSGVELGYAYPFLSLSYVLVLIASWALFREEVSALRLLGVAAVCLGVYVAASGW